MVFELDLKIKLTHKGRKDLNMTNMIFLPFLLNPLKINKQRNGKT